MPNYINQANEMNFQLRLDTNLFSYLKQKILNSITSIMNILNMQQTKINIKFSISKYDEYLKNFFFEIEKIFNHHQKCL